MKKSIDQILDSYGELLAAVDGWFARASAGSRGNMACAAGCSQCCRGLFDITLLDALYLRRGFDLLNPKLRAQALSQASERLVSLRAVWPDLEQPFILNVRPEEEWDDLMPDQDETPCPLLGEDGLCLVYHYRPMTCRLHGIPLVDLSGEVFHDEWCTMNFTTEDPLSWEELRWEFKRCFQDELTIFRELTHSLFEQDLNEMDILIPLALLVDLKVYDWRDWWKNNAERVRAAGFPENSLQAPSP